MAKSNKTDKSVDAQTKDAAKVDEIIDAEVVQEQPSEPDVETSLAIEEPEAPETEAVAEDSEESAELDAPLATLDEKPSSGFLPLALGGVLAAAVGFAAASYLGSQGILFGSNSDEAVAELQVKLEEQSNLVQALQSNQAQISDVANAAREGVSSAAEADARAAGLSQRVEDLGAKLVTLEGRMIEAEKRPMTEGLSSTAIEAYEREVEQLRALVSEQLVEAENLKEHSTRTARETLAQAALTRVFSALDSGVPYRGALTELAGATGAAIPEALASHADTGVPTNMALADQFPEHARNALTDARKQEKGDNGSSLGHFLKTQLGARSTEPKEGNDADAILSRAEAALREGRLADSLSELTALPETSQAVMADWRALAETRVAAIQAVDTLAQSLNSN